MIIPIAHEDQRGRRWPYVTIAIIALNVVVFLFTHSKMEAEQRQFAQVQFHILALSARYPDLQLPPEATDMVEAFKREHARLYLTLEVPHRRPYDDWDAHLLSGTWTDMILQAQLARLTTQLDQFHHNSLAWNYAFHPYHPTAISYISANFLHGGWLHLIFNMWFLWLAGTVLEDAWGRLIYPLFYLLAGAVALLVHAGVFSGSIVPVLGASGAVAGLMGAFLVRFAKTRIKLLLFLWLGFRPYLHRFSAPAYAVLPVWFVTQLFWALLTGSGGGVAYWAHIGGFAFGVGAALVLRATGIEHKM